MNNATTPDPKEVVLQRVKHAADHGSNAECFSFQLSRHLIAAADELVANGKLKFDHESQSARWYGLP
jgi:hypothetical protein